MAGIRPGTRCVFATETSEQNCNIRIKWNGTIIKIDKVKEELNILNLTRSRPFLNSLNFVFRHCKSSKRQYKIKVLYCVSIECTFASFSIESMLLKISEDLLDQLIMLVYAISIDQDIIQIDDNPIVKQISEDIVHEILKGGKNVSQIKWHYQPLKGTIVSSEDGLPFIAFSNPDQVVDMSEVNFGEDVCLCW